MTTLTKRILAAMLCALTLTPLIACSSDTSSDTGATAVGADTTTVETTTEPEVKEPTAYDYLEKKDYEGYEFRIIAPTKQTRYFPHTVVPEEVTGDIIYDAAFERNNAVEEYFNVKMKYVDGIDRTTGPQMVLTAVNAGEDAYDFTHLALTYSGNLAAEGAFLDVNDLPNIHTDMPWYTQKINDNISIGNKLKTFASNFNCIALACTYGVFVNQTMAYETFGLPDIYQSVFDGEWTHDMMVEYSKDVAADIDGDGAMTISDRYGFAYYGETQIMQQYGMGQFTTKLNSDGLPELVLNTERMATITEKLNTLYHSDETLDDYTNEALKSFAANRILFLNAIIMHAPNYMRDMEDTYGILPMPKFDESQDEYYTSLSPGSAMIEGIPVTVKDPDMVSAIVELLAYEGHTKIIPAFFETSMKVKYSRDEVSSQIFDLLRENTVVDFGLVFDGGVGMSTLIQKCISNNSDSFTSYYAAIEEKALAQYQKVIDSLTK